MAILGMRYTEDELRLRIDSLQDKIESLTTTVEEVSESIVEPTETENPIPGMVNLADNTDFGFRDTDYISAVYSSPDSPDNVLALWYAISQSAGSTPVESTPSTESSQAITSGGSDVLWNKSAGTIGMSGGYYILTPLRKPYAYKGCQIVVRLELAKKAGATFGNNLRLRISLHDGTSGQNKIIEGQPFSANATRIGTDAGVTRQYIIEVATPAGSYYSDVAPPTVGTVATATPDEANYVAVSWPSFPEQTSYRIWRKASDVSGGYRLIYEVFSGATSYKDKGGIPSVQLGGTGAAPSQINPKALAVIDKIGEALTESLQSFLVTIQTPLTYDPSLTTGKQFLRIELVKSDNSNTSTSDVSSAGLVVDKVGLSYTNGRWTPSAHDQEVQATIQATNPPPPPPPGGGDTPPDPGGGGREGCVVGSTLVTVVALDGKREQIPISNVKRGMRVLSVDSKGNLEVSLIINVFKKTTTKLYEFCTESGKSVVCSPTHPLLRYIGDESQKAFKIEDGTLLTYEEGDSKARVENISFIESWNVKTTVYSLELNNSSRTFITNGVVSHNVIKKELGL
jgi:hypothetical protein